MRELTFKDKAELNQKARRHGLPTLWPEADMDKMLREIWRQQGEGIVQRQRALDYHPDRARPSFLGQGDLRR